MKSKQWLNNARFTSWWLDISDLSWPDPQLTQKWRHRAETFQKQGVNAVVMFGFHFRWDYHSILERVFGALREIADICHEHGLHVVEHHSATLVHRVRSVDDRRTIQEENDRHIPFYPDNWDAAIYRSEKMEDWRQISARDGRPVFLERSASECFCPNHPGFQSAYFDLIDRHLAAVPIDAVMSDDLHFLPDIYSCACSHCRKRFADETGFEIPSTGDTDFWENRKNPAFLAWISARYRWNADHYRRLRNRLPPEVLLWGGTARCLSEDLPQLGSSPQLFARHFDAIFHEVFHGFHLHADRREIVSELAAFNSLARHHQKPLIALGHARSPDDLPGWLSLFQEHGARPWISQQIRNRNAVPEEQLLEPGFQFPKTAKPKPASESIQAIAFSETLRDRLAPVEAEIYVEECRQLCSDLIRRGSRPFFVFDTMWETATPALWECLWIVDTRSLDDEKLAKLREWQKQGLAVGTF